MPPPYPLKKADKDVLYAAIIAGVAANPADFPSGIGAMFNTGVLTTRSSTKTAAVTDRMQKEGIFRLAVDAENAAYDAADFEARRLIGLAEAQFSQSAPEKLLLIGWGPRVPPQSIPPGAPRNLEAFPQNPTSLTLDWKPPIGGSGGSVAFYRIERQTKTLQGVVTEPWGVWSTQAVQSEITLAGLERGVEYEFRVVAVNAAGDSVASNTVAAVL